MSDPLNSPEAQAARALLSKLLGGAASVKASDLHLRVGAPPFVRLDGVLSRTNAPATTDAEMERMVLITSGRAPGASGLDDWEYSFEQANGARFRGHVFRESGRWALTIRVIPPGIPTFQELRLPPVVKTLSEKQTGLVLITGPTGSGKTTTAAAMLKQLASSSPAHVITIEDPVEYRLQEPNSCITQREVGRDTPSYEAGLKAALREDPDVLFIGEIRDRYALEVAMQAAETGHAVLSTFHTGTVVQTIQRLVSMFSNEEQQSARERIADSLRGIIAQRLLPRKKTRGRVLCTEVMVNTYTTKECIRDIARLKGLPAVLERSGDRLMHSLDQQLALLIREELIEVEVGLSHASSPGDMRRTLNLAGMVA